MSKKDVDRLAVILAGEFRTWAIASKYIFNFFDRRSDNVDYFFATWDVTSTTLELLPVTEEDIRRPFIEHGKNLADFCLVPTIGKQKTTFYNQAWLVKVANLLKRQYERNNNIIYDQVVDTRPDIYLRPGQAKMRPWHKCVDGEYEGTVPYTNTNNGFLGIHDVYFRSNSFTHDLMAERFYFSYNEAHQILHDDTHWEFTNHHWTLASLFNHRLIKAQSIHEQYDYDYYCIIRPNFPGNVNLDNLSESELTALVDEWGRTHDSFFLGNQVKK